MAYNNFYEHAREMAGDRDHLVFLRLMGDASYFLKKLHRFQSAPTQPSQSETQIAQHRLDEIAKTDHPTLHEVISELREYEDHFKEPKNYVTRIHHTLSERLSNLARLAYHKPGNASAA